MLRIENIFLDGQGRKLLRGITFEAEDGEYVCVTGEKGSGKSCLLKLLAGQYKNKMGRIYRDMQEMKTGILRVSEEDFPSSGKTVENELEERLPRQMNKEEKAAFIDKTLETWNMQDAKKLPVKYLSRGEKCCLSLSLALFNHCQLLLMEETGWDHDTFETALQLIRDQQKETGMVVLHGVSDQKSAMEKADKILLLHKGRMISFDTPENLYRLPENTFSARYFGRENMIPVEISGVNRKTAMAAMEVEGITLHAALRHEGESGDRCILSLHPEQVQVSQENIPKGQNLFCQVLGNRFSCGKSTLSLKMPWGNTWQAVSFEKEALPFEEGSQVFVSWREEDAALTPDDGQLF